MPINSVVIQTIIKILKGIKKYPCSKKSKTPCIDKTLSVSLRDCTNGKYYKIYRFTELGNPSIIDDNNDNVDLTSGKRKAFKKIINNQTTTINYVKSNSNNSFEL